MKKVIICIVSVFMCITFLMQYVSAAASDIVFNISQVELQSYLITNKGSSVDEIRLFLLGQNVPNTNSYTFLESGQVTANSLLNKLYNSGYTNYECSLVTRFRGSFPEIDTSKVLSSNYVSFNFDVSFDLLVSVLPDNVSPVTFDYNRFDDCIQRIDVKINDQWFFRLATFLSINYVSDNRYNASVIFQTNDLNELGIYNLNEIQAFLPFALSFPSGFNYASYEYVLNINDISVTPIQVLPTSDMLYYIQGSLDGLNNQVSNIAGIVNNINNNVQQMPDKIVSGLVDADLGEPYTGSPDTSNIAEYESQMALVQSMIDVDDVNSVLGEVSFDDGDNYSVSSLDSVSGFMQQLIDATGLESLIILTLSLGLAAFVLGRTRYLR